MKTTELQQYFRLTMVKEWTRSKWGRGVQEYANELLNELVENYDSFDGIAELKKCLLNGADNWYEYSEGGNSLIYNEDIAERLATATEIRMRTNKAGYLNNWANAREQWIDVQARALYQAWRRIREVYLAYKEELIK